MNLRTRLILIFLFLALIPLSVTGWMIVRILDEEVTHQTDIFRNQRLAALSQRIDWNLFRAAIALRQGIETFNINSLSSEEKTGLLRILYKQRTFLNGIGITDTNGNWLVEPVFLDKLEHIQNNFSGHTIASKKDMELIRGLISIPALKKHGIVWGNVIFLEKEKIPHIPLILLIKQNGEDALVAVSLISIPEAAGTKIAFKEFENIPSQENPQVFLIDSEKNIIFSSKNSSSENFPSTNHSQLNFNDNIKNTFDIPDSLQKLINQGGSGQMVFDRDETSYLMAWYSLSILPWKVITIQSVEDAYRFVREPKRDILYWMGVSVIIAIIFGAYFSQSISKPIRELAQGVLEIARGNLKTRVNINSSSEIGGLADTFNFMASELNSQKEEIDRQSSEIRAWNRELKARVESRTHELKEAQSYLIHTQKLAAVAEIGSGVAHELNNPLTAILGFVQILLEKYNDLSSEYTLNSSTIAQDIRILQMVETQTQRCRETVHHLLKFSQEQVDRGSYNTVDLFEAITMVLKLFDGHFNAKKIKIDNYLIKDSLFCWGNRAQLLQGFLQLFSSIRTIISNDDTLSVRGESDSGWVKITIEGPLEELCYTEKELFNRSSIGQDQMMAQGLGIWLARKIFQEHKGGLENELNDDPQIKEPGAKLIILLPTNKLS